MPAKLTEQELIARYSTFSIAKDYPLTGRYTNDKVHYGSFEKMYKDYGLTKVRL